MNSITYKSIRILFKIIVIFKKSSRQKFSKYLFNQFLEVRMGGSNSSKKSTSTKSISESISKSIIFCPKSLNGKGFDYSSLDKKLLNPLEKNKKITKIMVYSSPLKDINI